VIRGLLARFFAPRTTRDRWAGNHASFADACAGGRAVRYAELAQRAEYIAARLDPRGAASGAREAEALDSKHRGLLAALEQVQAAEDAPLHVIDFGGGLGLHHRALAPRLGLERLARWTVVELPAVCAAGRAAPPAAGLAYADSLTQAATGDEPRVVLASGVLNALEDPIAALRAFAEAAPWIVLGSLPLLTVPSHRVAVNISHEPPFPLWFFSENQFLEDIRGIGLRGVQRWTVLETRWHLDGSDTPAATGLLLERSNAS